MKKAGHCILGNRSSDDAMDSAPELLIEAARDLLAICRVLNEPSPASLILHSPAMGKSELLGSAYRAVGAAVELARDVQDDPDRFGLDRVNGVTLAIVLRGVARELEREADALGQA